MTLGLFMMVRDEEREIIGCLESIVDVFDQVIVVDTGSVDGTQDALRALGIEPESDRLAEERCWSHADLRNRWFASFQTEWIMTLDADERVSRGAIEAFIQQLKLDTEVGGFFSSWINWDGRGGFFEDYKCAVFRKGVQMRGLIHDNPQFHLRVRGLSAVWEERLVINHYPSQEKAAAKRRRYAQRLSCAMRLEPQWLRYRWFWGYSLLRSGKIDEAARQFEVLHYACARLFPVECLNASMVLAECYARRGLRAPAAEVLSRTLDFHREIEEDFEVRVNFRVVPWLYRASEACALGKLEEVRSYEFAF